MKVIITGAYGQLGSELKKIQSKFSGMDFLFTDFDTLDITNVTAVDAFFEKSQPGFVVNCAAYTSVDKAENDSDKAYLLNKTGPEILAEMCKKYGARLIQISTDYVFDGKGHRPYVEDDVVNPSGIYGKSKLDGEICCMKILPDSIIIRTSWLYSSFGNNFVKTMLRLGNEKEALNVVFDQIGTPTFAGDLAEVILRIIQSKKIVPGIYHYSNEGVASWYDFTLAIHEIAGISCAISPVESKEFKTEAERPHYSVLNKSKIKSTFQVPIPYWKDSLVRCVKDILNN